MQEILKKLYNEKFAIEKEIKRLKENETENSDLINCYEWRLGGLVFAINLLYDEINK